MPTLLLSDDSATVQRLVSMTFADHDIQVTAVADGEEAIARITRDRPDIVLASIATPKRSGYDVAAYVKSTPELAATPVLLLAAAFEPVDEIRAVQVRSDGVLVKPLDPQQVVTRVKELLRPTPGAGLPAARLASPVTAAVEPLTSQAPDSVDEYFERLDAAFAQRSPVRAPAPADDVGTVPTVNAVLRPTAAMPPPAAPASPVVTEPTVTEPTVTDALVDEITRRVAERLGTAALRDVLADVVADVAERLIREEIGRIRRK